MFDVKIAKLKNQELFDIESEIAKEREKAEQAEQPTTEKPTNAQTEIDYRAINEEIKQNDNDDLEETEIEKPDISKQNGSTGGGGKRSTHNKENDIAKDINGFKAESKVFSNPFAKRLRTIILCLI